MGVLKNVVFIPKYLPNSIDSYFIGFFTVKFDTYPCNSRNYKTEFRLFSITDGRRIKEGGKKAGWRKLIYNLGWEIHKSCNIQS